MTPEEPQYAPEEQHWRDLRDELFFLTSKQGIPGWRFLANCLFYAIERHHGPTAARDIFDKSGVIPKRMRAALKKMYVLKRLIEMRKPNIAKLARDLAKENKKLPEEQQHGPGGTNSSNMETYIRRAIRG